MISNPRSWFIYPGSLCRVGGFLQNPSKIKGVGIIIEEAYLDFGYGLGREEWYVFVNGNIEKLSVSSLWPLSEKT